MNDDGIELLNLQLTAEEKKKIKEDIVSNKKVISNVLSEARKAAKGQRCLYCGKEQTSFCNSHTVPAFCLRNIAKEGKVYNSNKVIDNPLMSEENGVNQSGTFQLICRSCDSTIFQDYENLDNYNSQPNGKKLAEIAMKNYLKVISKRLNELKMPDAALGLGITYPAQLKDVQDKIKRMDLAEDEKEFERAKRLSKKSVNEEYCMIYYKELDYVIPIAYQGTIALLGDLECNIINNIYIPDADYRLASLHLCLFPFDNKSVVMMFVDVRDKRYRAFRKQFSKKTELEKLAIINYMLFLYTEDYFVSKDIEQIITSCDELQKVAAKVSDVLVDNPNKNPIEKACKEYDLNNFNMIPNLLSEKYKIK